MPRSLEFLLGLVILIELALPFFKRTAGIDASELILLIREYSKLISAGILLPRWAPDGFFGFGSPAFYFYPPVAFFLCGIVRVVTGVSDPIVLFHAASFVATIGSFITARVLLKSLGSRGYQRNLGALIYTFAPYRIAELYSRSSITCHVGYMFLPLVWCGLVLIVRGPAAVRWKGILMLGISFALMALTNVPLMLITSGSIVVAGVVCWKKLSWKALGSVAIAALIAVGLSAFHFSAVLGVRAQTQLKAIRGIPEYLVTHLAGNLPTAYHEGLIYGAILIAGLAYWRSRKRSGTSITAAERTLMHLGIAFTAVMVLLETPFLSWSLWYHFLILEFTVGAERYYIELVVFVAVLVGIARSERMRSAARTIVWLWTFGALFPALLVLFNIHVFSHSQALPHDPAEYLPIYTVSEDSLSQIRNREHVPPVLASFQAGEQIRLQRHGSTFDVFDVTTYQPLVATFHRFYWPQWHLYANSIEIPSKPDALGEAQALVPAGHYRLSWELEPTPMEQAGRWVSLITIGLVMAAAGVNRIRIWRSKPLPKEPKA